MNAIDKAGRGLKARASTLAAFVGTLWILEIVDFVLPGTPLDAFGIRPREISSLPMILTAPFLHSGFAHLLANTIPLLVLSWLVMLRSVSDFARVIWTTILIAGAGTWLFGAPGTIHLGASSIVFGFIGFLLFRGVFEKSALWIIVALAVAVLYGGALWGLVFLSSEVSWTGHFFGFAGGIVAARKTGRG